MWQLCLTSTVSNPRCEGSGRVRRGLFRGWFGGVCLGMWFVLARFGKTLIRERCDQVPFRLGMVGSGMLRFVSAWYGNTVICDG